ncbi:MAG: cytochrome c [Nitrospiraceae bacterium]
MGYRLAGLVAVLHVVIPASSMAETGPNNTPRTPAAGQAGDPIKGKALFERYCVACHGPTGSGDGYRLLGRSPADLTSPHTTGKPNEKLLETIHRGTTNMPPWSPRLSPQRQQDVLAYVRTLSRP